MNDASPMASTSAHQQQHQHKPRQSTRGGGGFSNRGHGHSKNKTWVSGQAHSSSTPTEGKWERGRGSGSHRSRGGRGSQHLSLTNGRGGGRHSNTTSNAPSNYGTEDEDAGVSDADTGSSHFPVSFPASNNGRTKTWEELVKAREVERARAIREGKMDDPTKPKRLDEAITIVGTCQDMCPEFERYRRERENNLDKWECIIGPDGKSTKKVDHARAVKIYERGQGDKIIPSDLRPAPVLKKTLDYLFHDLIPRGGFAETQAFVRDRSRAVRTDFTMQQDMGPVAIECHERCTRFHILSLHLLYDVPTFDRALEMQQLMNSLLSLKEFYDDQRAVYQSPNELEMRIYQRLGLIRDQKERSDKPPPHIETDPAFKLITRFRAEVQAASSPITKTSKMKVNAAAMSTFMELAGVLRERGNIIMIYLIACFLEHIFGKDTIDDIESIRGGLSIQDIIDGNSEMARSEEADAEADEDENMDDRATQGQTDDDEINAFIDEEEDVEEEMSKEPEVPPAQPTPSPFLYNNFGGASGQPSAKSSFPPISAPSGSVFEKIVSSATKSSVFGGTPSVFGNTSKNIFGGPVFGATPTVSVTPPAPVQKSDAQPQLSVSTPLSSAPSQNPLPPRRSLADAPPLVSEGSEDHVDPSEAVQTLRPPPFAASRSAPLNPTAPAFDPTAIRTSFSATPPPPSSTPTASRANLPPIRTDSLLQRIVDPNRGIFATPSAVSPSFSFPSPEKSGSGNSLLLDAGETRKQATIESPIAPPPMNRKVPISLPGTPTATSANFALPSAGPSTPTTPYHVPGLRVNIAPSPSHTPTFPSSNSRFDSVYTPGPPSSIFSSPLAYESFIADPEPVPQVESKPDVSKKHLMPELKAKADEYNRAHSKLPEFFTLWKEKALKEVAYKKALEREEEYKRRKKSESTKLISKSASFKRRRSNSDVAREQGQTRSRRRIQRKSNGTQPLNDEELVQRLIRNREENERRWARGSFVKAIRTYVQSRIDTIPSNWSVWLCMNADNDQTAIWLENKFDVPTSGTWESEAVFSILVSPQPSIECFPGLIIFECTSLDGADDEIERKYRVLDDCARLRDIITMLPTRRHYTPSIMFINWDAKIGGSIAPDILDMAKKYVEDKTLRSFSITTLASGDVDSIFVDCLVKTDADVDGDLIEKLNLQDMFEHLSSLWRDASLVWITACSSDPENFDWVMFSYVLSHFAEALNRLLKAVFSTWHPKLPLPSVLPLPSFSEIRSENHVIQAINKWLRLPVFEALYRSQGVAVADFDRDTDIQALLDHILYLSFLHAKQSTRISEQKRPVLKAKLENAITDFTKTVEDSQEQLREDIKVALPLSVSSSSARSKRRSGEIKSDSSMANASATRSLSQSRSLSPIHTNGTGLMSTSASLSSDQGATSSMTSPSPTPSAFSAINAIVSAPSVFSPFTTSSSVGTSSIPAAGFSLNGTAGASDTVPLVAPSTSVKDSSSSIITAAMLRELSRNLLKTYGSA